jgi:hypothetical protein
MIILLKHINMCLFEVTALSGCLVAAWLTLRLRIEEMPISEGNWLQKFTEWTVADTRGRMVSSVASRTGG